MDSFFSKILCIDLVKKTTDKISLNKDSPKVQTPSYTEEEINNAWKSTITKSERKDS